MTFCFHKDLKKMIGEVRHNLGTHIYIPSQTRAGDTAILNLMQTNEILELKSDMRVVVYFHNALSGK